MSQSGAQSGAQEKLTGHVSHLIGREGSLLMYTCTVRTARNRAIFLFFSFFSSFRVVWMGRDPRQAAARYTRVAFVPPSFPEGRRQGGEGGEERVASVLALPVARGLWFYLLT